MRKGVTVSKVEEMVMAELRNQRELSPIERGVVWRRGEDETRLWFEKSSLPSGEFGLCAVARIETVFGLRLGNWTESDICHLNHYCCFGSFSFEDGRVCLKASISIYEEEPAAHWIAIAILRALGEQLALGFGIAQSFAIPDTLSGNRENLDYPTKWSRIQGSQVFSEAAATFRQRGYVSSDDEAEVVLEVPMGGRSLSRLTDALAETAFIRVAADIDHPLAGCGYAATIDLPLVPAVDDVYRLCSYLNRQEFLVDDFVPKLGSWYVGQKDGRLGYSFFWPTSQSDDGLPGTILNWMVLRTLWLRDTYWEVGKGVPTTILSHS
jgi:hypothetical protein